MRISAAALGEKPANFAPDPDALSRVSNLICPLGDADACQFRHAPKRPSRPGTKQCHATWRFFGFTRTALVLYSRTVFTHLILIGQ
jgi:hypothetical protein